MAPARTPLAGLAFQVEVPSTRTVSDRDRHVDRVIAAVDAELAVAPADLVVLPELSTISYDRGTFERLDDLAETLEGRSVAAFASLAQRHSATVVFGMPRRDGKQTLISQVAIGPSGERIGHFDKLHAAQFGHSMEKEFFDRGDHLLTFTCAGLIVAPIICYDIRFPELARSLVVDHGVDLLLHCSAFSRDESFPSWHAFLIARAMENQVPVLGLSRAGVGWGGSMLCGPWVDDAHPPLRFPEHDEAIVRFEIDPTQIAEVRRDYTFLDDRLPSYQNLPTS